MDVVVDELELHARALRVRFRNALNLSLAFLAVLGAVFFWLPPEWARPLAVRPIEAQGLWGVLSAPLLHGDFGHLAGNAFVIAVLGTLAGTLFPRATLRALLPIWLLSGGAAWLLGRAGEFHLGASGLSHGLAYLIIMLGLLRRDRSSLAAAGIAFFFSSGLLLSILPNEPGISWQSHLGGAVGGVLAAVLWRRADPLPPRRRYSWEIEEEAAARAAEDGELELSSPPQVPVIWQRLPESRGVLLRFPARTAAASDERSPPQR